MKYYNILNDIPEKVLISVIEKVGYDKYLPYTLLNDLLIIAKYKLLGININLQHEYTNSLHTLLSSVVLRKWLEDTITLIKILGTKYDLREIERYCNKKSKFNSDKLSFSFNYKFDLKSINNNVKTLLNITEDHEKYITELPEDSVKILELANGYGNLLNFGKSYSTTSKKMSSYSEFIKIKAHNYAYPWFDYKLSIKGFFVNKTNTIEHNSRDVVFGYFLGSYMHHFNIKSILKLFGALLLNYNLENINIIVYYFYGDSFKKSILTTEEEVINYFSLDKQLKLFPIDNSKALSTMLFENPGKDIIYFPNVKNNCYVNNQSLNNSRINMVSSFKSPYNLQYSMICKKSGGIFIKI
jgi:hypothetical protein